MDISQNRRLLSLYKEFKCLWDPKDVNFTKRGVRHNAWRQISRKMEDKPIDDLKKKMRSLAGGYRREKYREKQSRKTGSGAQDTYKSKWFAYDDFEFMAVKKEPGATSDTLEHINQIPITNQLIDDSQVDCQDSSTNAGPDSSEDEEDSTSGKKRRGSPLEKTLGENQLTDQMLKEISSHLHVLASQKDDCYDTFGKYVASLLRSMPPKRAMAIQPTIMSLITDVALHEEVDLQPDNNTLIVKIEPEEER